MPPEQVGNEVKKDMNSFNNLLIAHIWLVWFYEDKNNYSNYVYDMDDVFTITVAEKAFPSILKN